MYLFYESDSGQTSYAPAAETVVEPSAAAHPLSTVSLPNDSQAAVGTLFEGLVATNETGDPVPIASITKVLTTLVVLEKAPLKPGEQGDSITLTQKDVDYYQKYIGIGGTVTNVVAGESMTQYQVLQTMLLASSNNMSDTIVEHYFGSVDEYLKQANIYLKENDLQNTKIADATGFSPESVSTPSDVLTFSQLALQNPVIKEIAAQKSANVPVAGEILNYNPLINEPNVTGLKPGFTDEAGATLVFSADVPLENGETKSVIGVVLGGHDASTYFTNLRDLLEQMRQKYSAL